MVVLIIRYYNKSYNLKVIRKYTQTKMGGAYLSQPKKEKVSEDGGNDKVSNQLN